MTALHRSLLVSLDILEGARYTLSKGIDESGGADKAVDRGREVGVSFGILELGSREELGAGRLAVLVD